LTKNKGVRYRKCRNWLHTTKLKRLHDNVTDEKGNSVDSSPADEHCESSPIPKVSRLTRAALSSCSNTCATSVTLLCFFCAEPGDDLRQFMNFSVNSKVQRCVTLINDNMLLGKLTGGDLIAAEAKYHPTYLLSLHRTAARAHTDADESNLVDDSVAINVNSESSALAELIAYMENIYSCITR